MVKHGKLKSGSKKKLNKWKKGQSSSSNPGTTTHRENAKSKFFHMVPTGNASKSNGGLTMEKLTLHDEMMDDKDFPNTRISDSGSEGGETFGTFLSGVSDCSNITFRKIQNYWRKNSAKHKEVCAVLAAITEVIRQNGGVESDVAYFAALVTALESVEGVESTTACAYLLSMTIKKVPAGVLQAKFSVVSKLLCDRLNEHATSSDGVVSAALLRSLIVCLATLLRHQSQFVWSQESTMNIYKTILNFTAHTKPKIRKAACNSIRAIMRSSDIMHDEKPPLFHPASDPTCHFTITCIEKSGSLTANASSNACHMVSLLGSVMHMFPLSALKHSCETILKLMTLSLPIVKSVCFQSLHEMFTNKPSQKSLPPPVNGQIITALYDYHPSASDVQMTSAWLAVMQKGIVHLTLISQQDFSLARNHIKKFTTVCLKLMCQNVRDVSDASSKALKFIYAEGLLVVKPDHEKEVASFVNDILKQLEGALNYKFHSAWDTVLELFYSVYKTLATRENFISAKDGLLTMAELRNSPLFSHKDKVDLAIGEAVSTFGPQLILEAIPLMIDGTEQDYDFPRSWLLPLFREKIQNTPLQFFISYFLPLAAKLKLRSIELLREKRVTESKTYDVLQLQMWGMLPRFCDGATDVHTSFPMLARTIGSAIQERDDLRLIAMQALRVLLTKSLDDPRDKETVARFAKNFLPILFNFYVGSSKKGGDVEMSEGFSAPKKKSVDHLGALETIRLYFKITESSLLETFYFRAVKRAFDDEDESYATKLTVLDLIIAMTTHLSQPTMFNLFNKTKSLLTSENSSQQKKAYRVLEELCTSREFVISQRDQLVNLLRDGLSMSCASAKGPRIKCMEEIVKVLAKTKDATQCREFIAAVLPEVVLCIREAKRSRMAGFSFLVTSCKLFVDVRTDEVEEKEEEATQALVDYFEIIFAGLAGSPLMITATIIALSRLVYQYKDTIPSVLLNDTIHNVCLLLGTNTREVCKAALGFVTVLLGLLDRATLSQHVKSIMEALFNWNPATRRHFRFRVKKILERLVKKFGYEMIYSLAPEDHRKQLTNMRKTSAREKRQKKEQGEKTTNKKMKKKAESVEELLADSSSDESDDEPSETAASAWIKDDGDEPVDLLSSSMAHNIIGKNPNVSGKSKQSKSDDFKTSVDGRLIINTPDDNANNEDMQAVLTQIGVNNANKIVAGSKRKMDVPDVSDDEEAKYQPGGKGIHRDLNKPASDYGSSYKAKKAKGDIKKKGLPDPYAYVPLNPSVLNKRKGKKLTGQYKGLVKATKFGSSKGRKAKAAQKKKMK